MDDGASQPGASPWGGVAVLAAVTGLWSFGVALAEPFLNAYLWTLDAGWVLLGLFNLSQFAAMVLAFPLAGRLAKGHGAVVSLRLAGVAVAAALALVLVLGPRAAHHVIAAGAVLGAGWGLYWLAQFVLSLDLTAYGRQRDRWESLSGALSTASGLVAPLLGGLLVAAGGGADAGLRGGGAAAAGGAGFRWLLATALAFVGAALLVALRLPRRGAGGGPFRLTTALPVRRPLAATGPAEAGWRAVLAAQAAVAFRDGVYLFAPALLVYSLSGSALDLGAYVTATQVLTLASYAALGRWSRPARRREVLLLGSALSTAAGALLVRPLTVPAAWAFGLYAAAVQPLLGVPLEACTLDVIDLRQAVRPGTRVEHTVVKEMLVNGMRVVSVGALVLAVAGSGPAAVRWWLAAVSAAPWLAWAALRRMPPESACPVPDPEQPAPLPPPPGRPADLAGEPDAAG